MRDDGSGVLDGADTEVTSASYLEPLMGVQSFRFLDGDPNVQVVHGSPRRFFVVAQLDDRAGSCPIRAARHVFREIRCQWGSGERTALAAQRSLTLVTESAALEHESAAAQMTE